MDEIVVVDYDPGWPAQFEEERARIAAALGDAAVGIEHVGSTAVPGLVAKPIIDILVGVRDFAAAGDYVERLKTIGYGRSESRSPGTRMSFNRGQPETHHLHIVEHEGAEWRRLLCFRDFLRENPGEARRYGFLKKELACRHRTDAYSYSDGKAPFIESALAGGLGHPR